MAARTAPAAVLPFMRGGYRMRAKRDKQARKKAYKFALFRRKRGIIREMVSIAKSRFCGKKSIFGKWLVVRSRPHIIIISLCHKHVRVESNYKVSRFRKRSSDRYVINLYDSGVPALLSPTA